MARLWNNSALALAQFYLEVNDNTKKQHWQHMAPERMRVIFETILHRISDYATEKKIEKILKSEL